MTKEIKRWFTGKFLLKAWGINPEVLADHLLKGLPVYDRPGKQAKKVYVAKNIMDSIQVQGLITLDRVAAIRDRFFAFPLEKEQGLGNECLPEIFMVSDLVQESDYQKRVQALQRISSFVIKKEDFESYRLKNDLPEVLTEADKKKRPIIAISQDDKKLRPVQKHKIVAIAEAKRLWGLDPTRTIQALAESDEINRLFEGRIYTIDTIRNWIKDLAPNRKPGRPRKSQI